MVSKQTHEHGKLAEQALRTAVYDELSRKAKLGQDAVIYRDGKTCTVKASELIPIPTKSITPHT